MSFKHRKDKGVDVEFKHSTAMAIAYLQAELQWSVGEMERFLEIDHPNFWQVRNAWRPLNPRRLLKLVKLAYQHGKEEEFINIALGEETEAGSRPVSILGDGWMITEARNRNLRRLGRKPW